MTASGNDINDDEDLATMLQRAHARGCQPDAADVDDNAIVIRLRPLNARDRLWAEQNFGCEYPICVANRKRVDDKSIRFANDKGVSYVLSRDAEGKLPGPDAYKFWLWFLTRCSQNAVTGNNEAATEPPIIPIDAHELASVFSVKKAQRGGYESTWYKSIDSAFTAFAGLRVRSTEALWDPVKRKRITKTEHLSLISYTAVTDDDGSGSVEHLRGWARPSVELWRSIRANYVLSLPAAGETARLSFVAQRLIAWLLKHARTSPDGYTVRASTLLPKIPLDAPSDQVKRQLARPHQELVDFGFFPRLPEYIGRSAELKIKYWVVGQKERDASQRSEQR